MKNTIRTFVAVEIEPAVRQRAAKAIERLKGTGADVTWVSPQNMHLTLKFLGEVKSHETAEICQAVEDAVEGVEPFELEIRGAGAFPRTDRPGTIWLGGGEGEKEVAALAGKIDDALDELGFRRETRGHKVHLTLGRVRRGGPGVEALGQLLPELADFEAGRTSIHEVVVFSSRLERTGPVYEPLGHAELTG